MIAVVMNVGTSQPAVRSTPARQELPTTTRKPSPTRAARAVCHGDHEIQRIPSPQAHATAPIVRPHTASTWIANNRPKPVAHGPERAHRRPHEPVADRAG